MKKSLLIGVLSLFLFPFMSHAALISCAPGDRFDVNTGKACVVATTDQSAYIASLIAQINDLKAQIALLKGVTVAAAPSNQSQVAALQQQILDLKKNYYLQVAVINSDPNVMQGITTSKIQALTQQLNQKIDLIYSQIAVLQSNPAVYIAPVTSTQGTGGSVTPPSNSQVATNVTIVNDSSTPPTNSLKVTDTTNGQYLFLPILTFGMKTNTQNTHLHQLTINLNSSGSGNITAAYLYQGSTQVASVGVSNGSAKFVNIIDGTPGAIISGSQDGYTAPTPYTLKVDVTGVTSTLQVSASVDSSGQTIYDQNDNDAQVSGSATGNIITVTN